MILTKPQARGYEALELSSHMMEHDQIAWMEWGGMTQNLKIPSTAQTAKPQLTASLYHHNAFICIQVFF